MRKFSFPEFNLLILSTLIFILITSIQPTAGLIHTVDTKITDMSSEVHTNYIGSSIHPDITSFQSTWNTSKVSTGSSASDQIKLPLVSSGSYDFTVDWGDTSSDAISNYNQAEITHTYATKGEYILSITGTISGWNFNNTGDKLKIIEISSWGNLAFEEGGNYFYGASNLVITATDAPDLSGTTTLKNAFRNCTYLGDSGNMSSWDTSTITDMSYMFEEATTFNQTMNSWNTASVTNMSYMFHNAENFDSPVGNWDVSNVKDMSSMFRGASFFNQNIASWDVSAVTRMDFMLAGLNNLFTYNVFSLDNWDVSSVTNMSGMFIGVHYGGRYTGQSLNSWDVASVTDMSYMFFGSWVNVSLSNWNVSGVTSMRFMFAHNPMFNQALETWDVSSVEDMWAMFVSSTAFNQPLNNWDTSSVQNMGGMFFNTPFNQPLDNWDTSSVTEMQQMFEYNKVFNQTLNNWDVSSVEDMSWMFHNTTSFNQPLDQWDVSNVLNMSKMFNNIALSRQNYDELLNAWSELPLQQDVVFDAGNSQYSAYAVDARKQIIDSFNWEIKDGGNIGYNLVPKAPINLDFTIKDNGNIVLVWDEPLSDGGAQITKYNIYRSTSQYNNYERIGTTTDLTYTDGTNELGVIYYYIVTAVNQIGESQQSVVLKVDPSSNTSLVTTRVEPDTLNPLGSNMYLWITGFTMMTLPILRRRQSSHLR